MIAYYFGGVYADSDIENFTPIKYWPCWEDDKVRVAVGIENSFIDENVRRESRHTHMTQITQWTFVKIWGVERQKGGWVGGCCQGND